MRALAHPDRRMFVTACAKRAHTVGELAELSSLALASVSEHLRVLRTAGLLELEAQGRFRLYRTSPARVRAVIAALATLARPR